MVQFSLVLPAHTFWLLALPIARSTVLSLLPAAVALPSLHLVVLFWFYLRFSFYSSPLHTFSSLRAYFCGVHDPRRVRYRARRGLLPPTGWFWFTIVFRSLFCCRSSIFYHTRDSRRLCVLPSPFLRAFLLVPSPSLPRSIFHYRPSPTIPYLWFRFISPYAATCHSLRYLPHRSIPYPFLPSSDYYVGSTYFYPFYTVLSLFRTFPVSYYHFGSVPPSNLRRSYTYYVHYHHRTALPALHTPALLPHGWIRSFSSSFFLYTFVRSGSAWRLRSVLHTRFPQLNAHAPACCSFTFVLPPFSAVPWQPAAAALLPL